MQKLKVIIVDDEPRAHKILENYIARTPELQLEGNFYDALSALDFLHKNKVDLLLLDITMPELDGFGLLRRIGAPPKVIFTTAHSEFAVESYEYNAIDYLKKPIAFERFQKAIHKLQHWMMIGVSIDAPVDYIDLRIDGTMRHIPLANIFYIQSLGNYVKVYVEGKVLITQITTKDIEFALPKSSFLRIHKSYIVNKDKIESYTDDEVVIRGEKLQIGKTFKKYVHEMLEKTRV